MRFEFGAKFLIVHPRRLRRLLEFSDLLLKRVEKRLDIPGILFREIRALDFQPIRRQSGELFPEGFDRLCEGAFLLLKKPLDRLLLLAEGLPALLVAVTQPGLALRLVAFQRGVLFSEQGGACALLLLQLVRTREALLFQRPGTGRIPVYDPLAADLVLILKPPQDLRLLYRGDRFQLFQFARQPQVVRQPEIRRLSRPVQAHRCA